MDNQRVKTETEGKDKKMGTLVLPPFVASAIVEHAKRRCNSAGYLIGNRTGDQITVTDYIPCTHASTMEVRSRAYAEDLSERVQLKRYYTPGITLLGWYAAGVPMPDEEEAFDLWCQAPCVSFSRSRSNNQAVMLLARMPTASHISVQWEAHVTSSVWVGDALRFGRVQEVAVSIEAETPSMNVLLAEIISKALCGGGAPYPTSRITNLDRVALEADSAKRDPRRETDTRPVETALANVQNKLHQTIVHARAVLASGAGKQKGDKDGEEAAIVANYEAILEEKNQQSSRDDFISESYKDALMMKYLAALLRRHVSEIERHGRYEAKEKAPHGAGGHPNATRKMASFR
ncbi:putative glycerol kinase, glycosomal [Trypanosoma theileri]|uniref:Putative glycerol kinase, glycosomal n=1 Tax=Trypanosoma theileri TaxID=67003 RepID=A0A1X0NYA8_9TRYP|nr:putative glycerol kinase, glycosomal [Trypanosoma theileri]ORC89657.1 putative glycerol kinase, glycosomal [Trypanosoma theileri]